MSSPSPTVGQSTTTGSMATAAKAENKGQFDEKLWSGMKWREIGPFRGGRGVAIEGVPGEPNTYYFGAVAGGVWKTTDGGANWKPMFDKQHSTSSIGALAVAPSDHNTITPAPASRRCAAISPMATAFISPSMAAAIGGMSA